MDVYFILFVVDGDVGEKTACGHREGRKTFFTFEKTVPFRWLSILLHVLTAILDYMPSHVLYLIL